ncbi:MAG: hypothetical protein ABIO24_07025 [Saprospiraceae bacterium]
MRFYPCFFLLTFALLTGCHFSDASTPEEVALLWQSSVDKNQFAQARALSVHQARKYVDKLDSITAGDTTQVSHTDLLQLQCAINGDKAVCSYLVEDETGEKHPDTMLLLQIKGRWIVDKVGGFEQVVNDTIDPGEGPALFPRDSSEQEME